MDGVWLRARIEAVRMNTAREARPRSWLGPHAPVLSFTSRVHNEKWTLVYM